MTEKLVLVVDDDAAVRRALKLALERDGIRVLLGENGVHALTVLAEAGEPAAVLLADVVMPEMGGVALAERLLATASPPAVILMSGFSHDPSRLMVSGRRAPFIQKPFTLPDVVRQVRTALAGAL